MCTNPQLNQRQTYQNQPLLLNLVLTTVTPSIRYTIQYSSSPLWWWLSGSISFTQTTTQSSNKAAHKVWHGFCMSPFFSQPLTATHVWQYTFSFFSILHSDLVLKKIDSFPCISCSLNPIVYNGLLFILQWSNVSIKFLDKGHIRVDGYLSNILASQQLLLFRDSMATNFLFYNGNVSQIPTHDISNNFYHLLLFYKKD